MDLKKGAEDILHTVNKHTQGSYWGGGSIPYWSLAVISVCFGMFGMDHLWLRSPTTAAIKTVGNVLTFGLWYLYDVIQILTEKEKVMTYGLSMPVGGPLGIGAGSFTDSGSAGSNGKGGWRWIAFCILAWLPFGFDYMIAGDYNGGFIRFFFSIFIGTWFLAFIWWAYNLGRTYWLSASVLESPLPRMWPVSMFMEAEGPNKMGPKDILPAEACDVGKNGFFGMISSTIGNILGPVVGGLIGPYGQAFKAVGQTAATTAEAAALSASTAKNIISKVGQGAKELVDVAVDTGIPTVKAVAGVAQMAPLGVESLGDLTGSVRGLAEEAAREKLKDAVAAGQAGGGIGIGTGSGDSSFVMWFLVGIIGIGIYSALRNGKAFSEGFSKRKDASDTPPQPSNA